MRARSSAPADAGLPARLESRLAELAADMRALRWYIPAAMACGVLLGILFANLLQLALAARSSG